MKRSTRIAAVVVLAAMAGGAVMRAPGNDVEDATPPPARILSTEISGSDLEFLTGAGPEMALLARLAELAKKRAVTPEVRAEAAAVYTEQTDAIARLKELSGRLRVPLDTEPNGAGLKVLQAIGKLKGVKFDKAYLDAKEDALETIMEAGAGSSDAAIKAFAQAGLQILKLERERVRRLGL